MKEKKFEIDELWYSDVSNGGVISCGCAFCDDVYEGRGMIQKLKKHVKDNHNVKIEQDGYFFRKS